MGLSVRNPPRRYAPRPKKGRFFRSGPWIGVRDSLDPNVDSQSFLQWARNIYRTPSGWEQRPGYARIATLLNGQIQGGYQFTELNGDEHSIVVAGGKFYEIAWSTFTVSEIVTTAQLTAAAITLSNSAAVYFDVYNNKLVVSDGVNTPWAWDGTSGGGLTKLTNAPVAYGKPTVYYAKLFFIKNSDRRTIVWSEENAENTGYEAGGYNNAWTLGQTDQDAIFVIRGTNEYLIYWRAYSIGAIGGAVTPDFVNAGTHDSISQSIGCSSPNGVCQIGASWFFIDSSLRPQRMSVTGGVQGENGGDFLWKPCDLTCRRVQEDKRPYCITIQDPATNMVIFNIAHDAGENSSAFNTRQLNYALVFDPADGEFMGIWEFATRVLGMFVHLETYSPSGTDQPVPRLMHGDDTGYVYYHGQTRGLSSIDNLWADVTSTGSYAITEFVAGTGHMGNDPVLERDFDRVDWGLRLPTSAVDIFPNWYTNQKSRPSTSTQVTGVYEDVPRQGPLQHRETKFSQGLGIQGRWLVAQLEIDVYTAQSYPMAFTSCAVTAYGGSDAPTAK